MRANHPQGRVDLPSAPGHLHFRGPEMRFAKQTSEENERYNHFQATADILSFREWRALNRWRDGNGGTLPVITTVKVRVGGTREEVEASLEVAGKEVMCKDNSATPSAMG